MVNQVYFYCLDEDFGPFFLKYSTYFPYTGRLCRPTLTDDGTRAGLKCVYWAV
jgi:hypothetical protein